MPKRSQLDTLLRVRRIEEDRAKAELATANFAERRAEAHLEATRESYRDTDMRLDEAAPEVFLRHRSKVTAMGAGVVLAELDCRDTGDAAVAARGVVRTARMRTQGLERLVDRAAHARFQEMLAADQRTAEESIAAKKTEGRL